LALELSLMFARGLIVGRLGLLLAFALATFAATSAVAQQPPTKKGPPFPIPKVGVPPQKGPMPPTKAPAPPPPKKTGPKLPDPEEISLDTKDGMTLKATFYPGTAKKEAVPVIMVHGLEGSRGDFHALATQLQTMGHASIVPDLRGHGQSKAQKRADGSSITLEAEKLNRPMLEAMDYDIQACKKYLMEKNNTGELNIEQLCVIGSEFGAILAVRWAAADWNLPQLPAYKQGQDVKALVLLSPPSSVKAVTLREALPALPANMSILIIAGSKDGKSAAEAKKLHGQLQLHHSKSDDKDLFLLQPENALSGVKLLGNAVAIDGVPVRNMIGNFIDKRLVQRKAEFVWQERKNPLGN
jgi:pimeloyl-ACP methyl ester carboxylesterase